jgi:hypothetical protein
VGVLVIVDEEVFDDDYGACRVECEQGEDEE